ncbi:MAG: rRNA pseudouridine synthase [candidate division Zixibacteria bacterium]|nr:rRNA pseudouridine synthase [candidate division Zixibacteria bacterium]
MATIRINKYLSMCGVTSRRGAEALIDQKRVTLNDQTVDKLGVVVNDEQDVVKVDGAEVSPVEKSVYVVLNKPRMVMTTLYDPFKRKTVLHCLKNLEHRVYPIGRLDYDAEGILLLTNDGDLAFRLAHPRYKVPKIYEARVHGHFTTENGAAIKKGIRLDDGAVGHADVAILGFVGKMTRIRLTLTEGRKREVKQLCKKVGHPVELLRRVEFAGMVLKNLNPGQWRHLEDREVTRLRQMVGLQQE